MPEYVGLGFQKNEVGIKKVKPDHDHHHKINSTFILNNHSLITAKQPAFKDYLQKTKKTPRKHLKSLYTHQFASLQDRVKEQVSPTGIQSPEQQQEGRACLGAEWKTLAPWQHAVGTFRQAHGHQAPSLLSASIIILKWLSKQRLNVRHDSMSVCNPTEIQHQSACALLCHLNDSQC